MKMHMKIRQQIIKQAVEIHKKLHYETVFRFKEDGIHAKTVDPKTIFRVALLKNANSIIIAHNHPSGELKPSSNDIDIFEMIKKAGDLISIKCLDSIIFNKKEFYSMN